MFLHEGIRIDYHHDGSGAASGAELQRRTIWEANLPKTRRYLQMLGIFLPEDALNPNAVPLDAHPGSQAEYLVRFSPDEGEIVYVQYMGPYKKSSIHYHRKGSELYLQIAGKLDVNGEPVVGLREIPAGLIHQATTRRDPALTVIIMEGTQGTPQDQIHTRLDPERGIQYIGRSAFEEGIQLPLMQSK